LLGSGYWLLANQERCASKTSAAKAVQMFRHLAARLEAAPFQNSIVQAFFSRLLGKQNARDSKRVCVRFEI